MAGIVNSTGVYTPNEIIVDATGGKTPFQTIAAAITAAATMGSPTTIYVRPGTYTEDLTLVDGINIVGENRHDTIIDGQHTVPTSGQIRFKDIKLAQSTPGSDVFVESEAGTCAIDVEGCIFNIDSGFSFNLVSSTGPIGVYNCLDISADNRFIDNSTMGSDITIRDSQVGNSTTLGSYFDGYTTIYNSHIGCRVQITKEVILKAYDSIFDTNIANTPGSTVNLIRCSIGDDIGVDGLLYARDCTLSGTISLSGYAQAYLWSSNMHTTSTNALIGESKIYLYGCDISIPGSHGITLSDTSEAHVFNSRLSSVTDVVIVIDATASAYFYNTVIDCTVASDTPITGAGTLYYENLTFSNSGTNIGSGITQDVRGLMRANNISLPEADAAGSEGVVRFGSDVSLHVRSDSIYLGAENFSGQNVVAIGEGAAESITTGSRIIAIGKGAASEGTNLIDSVCIGNNAGEYAHSDAKENVYIGAYSGSGSDVESIGSYNVGVGHCTLKVQDGYYCVAVGRNSLRENKNGTDQGFNTALGYDSGRHLATGQYNLLLSHNAGDAYTGAESSNIILMNSGTAAESNVIRIGTQGTGDGEQDTCYVAGIAGSWVSNQQAVVIDSATGQLGVSTTASTGSIELTSDDTFTNNATHWNNKADAQLSVALPSTAAIGTTIRIVGYASNGWTITQETGQQIHNDASTSTTVGTGGSITSNDRYDSMELLCVVADTEWVVVNVKGNPTVV